MKIEPLEKIYVTNTDFTLENYSALIIRKIGTDDTANVTIRIDGKACGIITSPMAPLRKIGTNMSGGLPLEDLFLVVPPLKLLRFDGTAAKNVLISGEIYELGPTEVLPADILARFAEQNTRFLTVISGSATATGTALADGAEVSIYSLTPTTIEEYVLAGRTLCQQVAAGSPAEAEGNLGLRLYVDGVPQDFLLGASGKRGISRFSLDIPGTGTNTMDPFSLANVGITVGGDHLLEAKIMNTSGGSLFGTTAAQFRFFAAARYRRAA